LNFVELSFSALLAFRSSLNNTLVSKFLGEITNVIFGSFAYCLETLSSISANGFGGDPSICQS